MIINIVSFCLLKASLFISLLSPSNLPLILYYSSTHFPIICADQYCSDITLSYQPILGLSKVWQIAFEKIHLAVVMAGGDEVGV
jgi:hypothetical protein